MLIAKEWREIVAQRGLMASLLITPLLFSVLPLVALALLPEVSTAERAQLGALAHDPAVAALAPRELAQLLVAQQFQVMVVMLPVLLPVVLSAQSVVGEKIRRTLEPLLSTPITTLELLVGKCLAALIPAVTLTWLSATVFLGGMAALGVSARVIARIATPSWLFVLGAVAPALALTAVAVTVVISSRTNDPRSAQQLSALLVLPGAALLLAQSMGVVQLGVAASIALVVALLAVAALVLRVAVRLFDREAILTRHK